MDAGIIIAIISAVVAVASGVLNLFSMRSKAKKETTEAEDILMNRAMALNKQEIETLRLMNDQLRADALEAKTELVEKEKATEELKKRVSELELEVHELRLELKYCTTEIKKYKGE